MLKGYIFSEKPLTSLYTGAGLLATRLDLLTTTTCFSIIRGFFTLFICGLVKKNKKEKKGKKKKRSCGGQGLTGEGFDGEEFRRA